MLEGNIFFARIGEITELYCTEVSMLRINNEQFPQRALCLLYLVNSGLSIKKVNW